MSRTCSVCTHAERHSIDKAIVGGQSAAEIAALFRVSPDAVQRHKEAHLPVALVKAAGAEEVRQALDVLQQLRFINAAALTVLRDAKGAGDGELVLKAIDRVMKQIEVQARLLGDLDERPVVNVLVSPEWLQLRGQILAALAPFPEARVAVAVALQC